MEREASLLDDGQRLDMRQAKAKPVADALHQWLLVQRQRVPAGSATFTVVVNKDVAFTSDLGNSVTGVKVNPVAVALIMNSVPDGKCMSSRIAFGITICPLLDNRTVSMMNLAEK